MPPPIQPKTPFELSQAAIEDMPAMVDIMRVAFAGDKINRVMFPVGEPATTRGGWEERHRASYYKPGTIFLCTRDPSLPKEVPKKPTPTPAPAPATQVNGDAAAAEEQGNAPAAQETGDAPAAAQDDSNGTITNAPSDQPESANHPIIGFAKWVYHREDRPESEWNVREPIPAMGPEVNMEAFTEFFTALREARLNTMQGRRHAFLHLLDVRPSHQRRGAGAQLLDHGIALADELHLPCYLEASTAGYHLYKSRGFEDVGSIDIDLEKWPAGKGLGMSRHMLMIRPAKV